jgi:DNA-binding FrmR family transcriptional regulator
MNETCPECQKQKHQPRDPKELKNLQTRLNRIIGQLNGIQKMLDENRYCGDVLNQIAACESALQQVGFIVLKTHMETCVTEDIKAGKEGSLDEALDLMKKLK